MKLFDGMSTGMGKFPEDDNRPANETDADLGNAIQTQNLSLTYNDGTKALKNVSLAVPRGSFFGFLGPNGAGKTTFIKVLVTLLRPTNGTVTVNGFDLSAKPQAIRETIGYMGQETRIDSELTARENLQFACRAYGVPKSQRDGRIEELLELVGLDDVAEKQADGFSGGMKKRLDAATALVHEPPLVFLDEPTTGLDPKSREELWEYFKSINKQGQTILLTTQYLEEANRLCDTISIIQSGEIIAGGTPTELKQRVGGQVLTIDLAEGTTQDKAIRVIRELGEAAENIEIDPVEGGISITGPDIQELTVDVLAALGAADLAVERFDLHEPTLDDVFLTLTGETVERNRDKQDSRVRS